MAVITNTVVTSGQSLQVREIDLVSRFSRDLSALLSVLGIARPIYKENGAQLYAKSVATVLNSQPSEGDEIDFSAQTFTESAVGTITLKKYAKGVSAEMVAKYGEDWAIAKSDESFLRQIQNVLIGDIYTYLATGQGTGTASDFQEALAKAKGKVDNFNKNNNLGGLGVVAFVNVEDFYAYLGSASVTVQEAFGLQYIQNFMGYRAIFLCGSNNVATGNIYATDIANLSLYAINPANSGFARLGLEYTIDELGILGVHVDGNYRRAIGETYALLGATLFAEYLAGVAVITF